MSKKVKVKKIALVKTLVVLLNASLREDGEDGYWSVHAGSVCWYNSPGPLHEKNMMTFDDFINHQILKYED